MATTTLFCRPLLRRATHMLISRPNLHRSVSYQAGHVVVSRLNLHRYLSCPASQQRASHHDHLESQVQPFPMPYDEKSLIRWEDELMEYYSRFDYKPAEDRSPWSPIMIDFGKPGTSDPIHLCVLGRSPPELSSCHYSIKRFLRHFKPRLALSFLAQMLVYGTTPNLFIFTLLIKSYFKHLTYQHVLDVVFIQMKALEVEGSYSFYKFLIGRVCILYGPIVGYQLLKDLRSSHRVQMPLPCYNAIVAQLCKRKKIDDAAIVLVLIDVSMDLQQQAVFPDEIIYNRLLKERGRGGEACLKALGIARQMFAKGIRIGEVYPATS